MKSRPSIRWFAPVLLLLCLVSCQPILDMLGLGSPKPVSISGSVVLDAEAAGMGGTLVIGLAESVPLDWAQARWEESLAKPIGLLVPYRFEDLAAGKYVVRAFVDLDGDFINDAAESGACWPPAGGGAQGLGTVDGAVVEADIHILAGGQSAGLEPVSLLAPDNGASEVGGTPTFTWQAVIPVSAPVLYDLYLGTANPPDAAAVSGLDAQTWTPAAPLAAGTTYYWYVRASDGVNSSTSPVRSFATAAAGAVEGFDNISFGSAASSWTKLAANTGTVQISLDPANGSRAKVLEIIDAITAQGDIGAVVYAPYNALLSHANLALNGNKVSVGFDLYLAEPGSWMVMGKTNQESFVVTDPSGSLSGYWSLNYRSINVQTGLWYRVTVIFNDASVGTYSLSVRLGANLVGSYSDVAFNSGDTYAATHLGSLEAGDGRLMFGSWFSYLGCPASSFGHFYIDNLEVSALP